MRFRARHALRPIRVLYKIAGMLLSSRLAVAALLALVPLSARAAPPTTAPAVPADVALTLAAARTAGGRVALDGFDFKAVPELKPVITDLPGPQFLLSDRPEYFRTGDGVAMQETVRPGDVRLYLYHVPTPDAGPKKITAVIENLGDGPLHVKFTKVIVPKVSKDYQKMGKQAQAELLGPDDPAAKRFDLTVPAGKTVLLDKGLDALRLTNDDLVHGIYAFGVDEPAKISVLQTAPDADATKAVATLAKLPQILPGWHASGAGRGLFAGANKAVTVAAPYDPATGPRQIMWADGTNEAWMTGRDSLAAADPSLGDAEPADKGHYGVVYRLSIPYVAGDGRDVSLLAYNPRAGGKWCNKQAVAVRVVTPGRLPTGRDGLVNVPADDVRYAGPPEAVLVQRFAAKAEGGQIELLYTPPGASCLPVAFLLVPVEAGK